MARRYYSSTAVATTLSASASNSATSISVTALSGFPNTTPWTAIIDEGTAAEEVVEVTNVSGTTLTVTRGTDGTTGVSHNAGATFKHGVSARDFDEPNAHIANTSNPHAVTAAQAGAVALTAVGAASGVASLDSSGSVPVSQLGNALTSSIALGSQQFAADGSVLANLPAQVPSAERLLKQAVWWIDAAHSSASGQSVSNLGWGGSALDAQLGSTTGADSNDPKYLDWSGENYVYLPGVAANYLSVPDEAALDITGDIDIRVQVAMDDWTPSASSVVLTKSPNNSDLNYRLAIAATTGYLSFAASPGGTYSAVQSTAAPTVADGAALWIRVTRDVGAGEVKFYTAPDSATMPSSWTQLGTTKAYSTTAPTANTASLVIGQYSTSVFAGSFHRAQILNGIDGTPVLDVDCSQITSGSATTFAALTGQTVTINRSTSGRKSVAVTHPCWLFGTDDYMEVADNDLIDFGASDDLTIVAVFRKWASDATTPIVFKRVSTSASAPGYNLMLLSNSDVQSGLNDGTNNVSVARADEGLGNLNVVGAIRNAGVTHTVIANDNQTSGSDTTGSLTNNYNLTLGSYSTQAAFADMEFVAAAIFRRALTSDEISTLNAYFQGRAV